MQKQWCIISKKKATWKTRKQWTRRKICSRILLSSSNTEEMFLIHINSRDLETIQKQYYFVFLHVKLFLIKEDWSDSFPWSTFPLNFGRGSFVSLGSQLAAESGWLTCLKSLSPLGVRQDGVQCHADTCGSSGFLAAALVHCSVVLLIFSEMGSSAADPLAALLCLHCSWCVSVVLPLSMITH